MSDFNDADNQETFPYFQGNKPAGIFTRSEAVRDALVRITGKQPHPDVDYGFDFLIEDDAELCNLLQDLVDLAFPGNP